MEPGLERIRQALARSGYPAFPVAQVLGTNGKGSTSAFLDSLGRAHGLVTGLFTSPHFVSVKERILLNGRQLPDEVWLEAASSIADRANLTYFEFVTAIAVRIFNEFRVDLAIFEAGMGGAGDATTALAPAIHCYGPIAMDHQGVIGPDLAAIAADKAAAIQAGSCVFSVEQYPEAAQELKKQAGLSSASLEFVTPLNPDASLGLRGDFQRRNAALALAAWRKVARDKQVDSAFEQEGLAQAFVAGRMQTVPASSAHPALLLDGSHNPHAISALVANLPAKPAAVIFSALADKNWRPSLALLLRLNSPLHLFQLRNERAASLSEMEAAAKAIRKDNIFTTDNPEQTLYSLRDCGGYVLICGSLYLLAAFFRGFPQYLQKERK